MMIIIILKSKIIPIKTTELLFFLSSMSKDVSKLNGCIKCNCYISAEDKNIFYFIEKWSCKKQINTHLKSELYNKIQWTLETLTEGFTVDILNTKNIYPTQNIAYKYKKNDLFLPSYP